MGKEGYETIRIIMPQGNKGQTTVLSKNILRKLDINDTVSGLINKVMWYIRTSKFLYQEEKKDILHTTLSGHMVMWVKR